MNFDDFYIRKGNYFSNDHSGGMEECLLKYKVKPCKAIDIGAGEGRNSLFLASLGFETIAIEPSKVGATKILKKAKENDLNVKVLNNDFLNVSSELKDVGFVVALTSLEHMETEYLLKTIEEIKRMMSNGAYIYIIVFTEEDPGFKRDLENASECSLFIKHYFKKDELKSYFEDFDILEYAEYLKEDTTHGPVHYHGKAKLFARKPL